MPWSTLKPREKTILRYLVLVVAGGLLLMSVRSLLSTPPAPGAVPSKPERPRAAGAIATEEAALDADLATVLGKVAGAGSVQVRVALAASDAQVYAVDTTTGRTTSPGSGTSGGTQTQESTKTVTLGNSALPVRVDAARVSSVLVVASGAAVPAVRVALARAAAAALGVPIYRVVVLAGAG